MRSVVLASLMILGAVLSGTKVQAQSAASQPAAGGTADGTPFDVPYGTPISLETAKKLVAAVEVEATKHRWKMNIAVVDGHGDLVHFSRMDGAQLASIGISEGKALHCGALPARDARFLQRLRDGPSLRGDA